ncbi:hydantoinase/oxoprolinase family protein [Temperatibacter marinus]|uniref:Hydantoinase/oxoprolinase family protein n=1 Tax=Temperatibacter marinus TaxID=1456591 RepID=A0AA52EGY9_9PROT|nr:hydantoinase/oxoprolinase family protein [Temperatibacter marinus]WND03478.1 hydantoinase/oxoprolinase family protein [Temperatibacter marinus]
MAFRLGVDVGGTFTDLLLIQEETGQTWRDKVPSTPHDPSEAVIAGTKAICDQAGIRASDITQFLHGTTVATNAVLEGKGAKTGLVVTEGYHQILQVARSLVPGGLAAWITWPKPEPLAALENTVEIEERLAADGSVVKPVNKEQCRAALEKLKAENIEALTICTINSYVNGQHELEIAEIAKEIFPDIPVSLSHQVLPEMQEYERALTTVANSLVRPIMAMYVANLRNELRAMGMTGHINLLRSDGGLMGSEKAEGHPVNLLMSGPAGGVTGALWVAKNSEQKNILTLDVGGTSTDVALIENGEPRLRRETSVGHLTVRASSLDVKTVGAGGGSIAHVPELTGALRVGPESAGAVPGPACYGKGGEVPTVTDAHVVLGNLPSALLGGSFKLDVDASRKAVQTIADALSVTLEEAAQGIIDIANENMFGALRLVSVQQGYDPRDFALMGFGGAGSLHSNAVGQLMGSYPIIVPVSPGVLCATGDATTQMRNEHARSFNRTIKQTDDAEVAQWLKDMKATVSKDLEEDGVPLDAQTITFEAGVRYSGQGFEVDMTINMSDFEKGKGIEALKAAFDEEHKRLFTFNLDVVHEIVNLRAIAIGQGAEMPAIKLERGDGNASAAKVSDHTMWAEGKKHEAAIYDRSRLKAGDIIPGPCIVTEMDSTAVILPNHEGTVDTYGNILINPVA